MKRNLIASPLEAKVFMFAGNSTVTFVSKATGKHFTYKIKKAKTRDIWFVKVLSSPDQYTFIGTVFEDGAFRHSKKSPYSSEALSVLSFSWVLARLNLPVMHPQLEVWHEGCCGRCGKKLTHPTSLDNGIGPECIKKMSLAMAV